MIRALILALLTAPLTAPLVVAPSHAATAEAVARATIVRPVTLQIDKQTARLTPSPDRTSPIPARKTARPCVPDSAQRCPLIVYDLP